MDPHSTQKKGRSCISCHQDPRAAGLGTGELYYRNGKWQFQPAMAAASGIPGLLHPLDAFVDISGTPLVNTSKSALRPFNNKEIEDILYVGLCVDCHADFKDSVMRNWQPGRPPQPCAASHLQEIRGIISR